jgi:DNA-directed RNA polymerase beta' subunit
MGLDTKKMAKHTPYKGLNTLTKVRQFKTGLVGSDSTGAQVVKKINMRGLNERKETADTLKRRKQGYRGL